MRLAAIVLTGGTAVRLDGVDKGSIEVGGATMLERVLAACASCDEVVVVGPEVPTSRPVTFTRESPAGGGPVAGVVAGRAALATPPDLLAVLAVDMPRLTAGTVARLAEAATGRDGAFLVADGRRQLAGVLRPDAVDWPAPEDAHGRSVRRFLEPLDLAEVEARGDEGLDVDTWEDLRAL